MAKRRTLNLTERKQRLSDLVSDSKTKCFSPQLVKEYEAQLKRVTEQLEIEREQIREKKEAEKNAQVPQETGVNNQISEGRQNG